MPWILSVVLSLPELAEFLVDVSRAFWIFYSQLISVASKDLLLPLDESIKAGRSKLDRPTVQTIKILSTN